jgi:cytochrome oxidase assembly protein ShyY1
MYRFAWQGRWLVSHVVVLIVAGLFVLAGFWQLDRLDQRRARNAETAARRAMPVIALEDLTVSEDPSVAGSAIGRRVTVKGTYDVDQQVVVQFRPLGGQTGEYVLTPLVTDRGDAVIVNRGWVPVAGSDTPLPPGSAPPAGAVTVTGLALPSETRTGLGPKTSTGDRVMVLPRVDLPRIQQQVRYDLYPVFVQLQTQAPPQPSDLPRPVPPEPLDNGPHLSYAIQWFSFAAIGLIGWPLVVRRAARERASRHIRGTLADGPVPVGR